MQIMARSSQQLASALQRRRKELGLTQVRLGRKAGLSQKAISKMEAGAPGVPLQTVFAVLTALDLEFLIQSRTKATKSIEDIF